MIKPASTALCIGHPGHEIRVLVWAAKHKPVVTIFTDGSGPDRESRLESTRRVLESVGCRPGSLFGGLKDREIYDMMLEGPKPFVAIAAQLEKEWTALGVSTVAGDGLEGFNPTHDLCRMVINAVCRKSRGRNHPLRNYSFALDGLLPSSGGAESMVVDLDDVAFRWKKDLVGQLYPEMAGEVERLLVSHGEAPFRCEVLSREPPGKAALLWRKPENPFYEKYGALKIKQGLYSHLITYREHMLPIAECLWEWAIEEDKAGACES